MLSKLKILVECTQSICKHFLLMYNSDLIMYKLEKHLENTFFLNHYAIACETGQIFSKHPTSNCNFKYIYNGFIFTVID